MIGPSLACEQTLPSWPRTGQQQQHHLRLLCQLWRHAFREKMQRGPTCGYVREGHRVVRKGSHRCLRLMIRSAGLDELLRSCEKSSIGESGVASGASLAILGWSSTQWQCQDGGRWDRTHSMLSVSDHTLGADVIRWAMSSYWHRVRRTLFSRQCACAAVLG